MECESDSRFTMTRLEGECFVSTLVFSFAVQQNNGINLFQRSDRCAIQFDELERKTAAATTLAREVEALGVRGHVG